LGKLLNKYLQRGGALFVLKRMLLENLPMNKQANINILTFCLFIFLIYLINICQKNDVLLRNIFFYIPNYLLFQETFNLFGGQNLTTKKQPRLSVSARTSAH